MKHEKEELENKSQNQTSLRGGATCCPDYGQKDICISLQKDQLVSYLLSKGLISRQQHAFIKKHLTETNVVVLQCSLLTTAV